MVEKVNELMPDIYELVYQEAPDYWWLHAPHDPPDEAIWLVLRAPSTRTTTPVYGQAFAMGKKENGLFITSLVAALLDQGPLGETAVRDIRAKAGTGRAAGAAIVERLTKSQYLTGIPHTDDITLGPRGLAELANPVATHHKCDACNELTSIFVTCDGTDADRAPEEGEQRAVCGRRYHYRCALKMTTEGRHCMCHDRQGIPDAAGRVPVDARQHLMG